ncbi:MAG: class I SAM-dependent methyltransferase [Thermodesulfobacteriota bacterium]
MSRKILEKYRKDLLSDVDGNILEIGFGTGINLPFYPDHVRKITVVEPNQGMNPKAMKRVASSGIQVDLKHMSVDSLPFPDNTFDSVVSTFTLCSVENVNKALSEVKRVLKQGGRFFFLEHGLSPDPNVEKWQNRLNAITNMFADGCNLNRNIKNLVESTELIISELENFYLEKTPRFGGYLYNGFADKE